MSDIKNLLPHRDPFLFVDRLEKYDGEEIIGYRRFRPEEFFFPGHFPGYPVVPGVILVETMAQCGGAGVAAQGLLKNAIFLLASVEKAKFRQQVRPGDEVRIVVKNLKVSKIALKQAGQMFLGDRLAAEAEWLCMVSQTELPK